MKKLDIDELRSIAAKTSVHEKRLLRTCLIIVLFGLLFALLILCFINDEWFTLNQMTFLGVFGASVVSVFTIFLTLSHEKRADYITARKSALLLSNILDSLYSQVEQINNGATFPIAYPHDWIRYYEKCCTYLEYDYLPYLLREFDIAEKLNNCIERNDKSGIKKLLDYRKKSITDWTLDFTILSAKLNLQMFASGFSEYAPWRQQKQYKNFKKHVIENYSNEIKDLTVEYLHNQNGHCDAKQAEYFVIEKLRNKIELQNSEYHYIVLENRAMLDAIFSVYLLLKPEDPFTLCWGELSLNKQEKERNEQ